MFKIREKPTSSIHSDLKCTECDSYMVQRSGKYGWFWGCSSYPKCKNTQQLGDGDPCPICKSKLKFNREKKSDVYFEAVVCTNKKCRYFKTLKTLNLRLSVPREQNPRGWTDEDWHEYADFCGIDSSICW